MAKTDLKGLLLLVLEIRVLYLEVYYSSILEYYK